MDKGFIKLHRSLKDWEWYDDANATRLLIHLLLSVNFTDKKWRGVTIKAGSFIFSWDTLSNDLGMSKQQLRTAMTKLEKSEEVTRKATNKWQVVTLCKWEKLQIKTTKVTRKATIKQHSSNNQITPTKECKEREEGKEVYRAFAHLSLSTIEFNKLSESWNKQQIDKILDSIENFTGNNKYKSLNLTARNWLQREFPTKDTIKVKTKQEIYNEELAKVLKDKYN